MPTPAVSSRRFRPPCPRARERGSTSSPEHGLNSADHSLHPVTVIARLDQGLDRANPPSILGRFRLTPTAAITRVRGYDGQLWISALRPCYPLSNTRRSLAEKADR